MMTIVLAVLAGLLVVPGSDGGVKPAVLPAPDLPHPDTLLYFDSGITATWWCSDRDSFGAGVKFTPGEYPCEVTVVRAEVNYDDGREIYLRVWDDDGPGGRPGTVLYNELRLDVPPNRTPGLRDYVLTAPVRIDSGDFYIVWWQRSIFDLVFSSDEAMNWPQRQWWFFPDQGWVTPYGMHASDHLIRARVRYGSGVEEELAAGAADRGRLRIFGNPAPRGRARVEWTGAKALLTVTDAGGRVVVSAGLGPARTVLQLPDLTVGVYLVRVRTPQQERSAKLVVSGQ